MYSLRDDKCRNKATRIAQKVAPTRRRTRVYAIEYADDTEQKMCAPHP